MKKPTPHVCDVAIAAVTKRDWRFHEYCERLLPSAGRFILTDSASVKLGRIVKETADLLLANHQFALPPVLPATYLELNLNLFHEALGKPVTSYAGVLPDERVGYLVTKDRIIAFASNPLGEAAPSPFSVRKVGSGYTHIQLPIAFSPQGYNAEELAARAMEIITETQAWNRLALLLGSGLHSMPDEETRQEFLDQWAIEPNYLGIDYRDPRLWAGGAGELRTAQAILLVLNQPAVFTAASVGRTVGISKGKRKVYAAHSVIDINLGKRKSYRKLFGTGTHASPRRHRVRGHFAHYHCTKGCVHDWPPVPDYISPPRWFCRVCNGLRVWRQHHLRGDASKGFVTNEYNVETDAA